MGAKKMKKKKKKKNRPGIDNEKEKGPKEALELEDFVTHMLTNKRSMNTVNSYKGAVRRMLAWIRKSPGKIRAEDLERYKTYMSIERNYSKNTLYLNIKAVQAFFKFLDLDVAKGLNPPKRAASLPKYLSQKEVGEMFEAALSDETNGIRDHTILTVLSYTGLRLSELCNLNTEDIDFAERTIKVLSGKGDKDRLVVFEERTEKALRDHLRDKDRHIAKKDPSAVFGSAKKNRITPRQIENIVRKYAKKAEINKKVTPHVLRHTMATTLLKGGADIRIIQQLLGHSSIATTQIYTHVDEEMLKKAYMKAKPKYE